METQKKTSTHRWASALYEKGLAQRVGKEREFLLQQGMRRLSSSAAMWGLQGPPDGRAVGVVSFGKISASDNPLESFGRKNPLLDQLTRERTVLVSKRSATCPPTVEATLDRQGFESAIVTVEKTSATQLAQILVWYRDELEQPFSGFDVEMAEACSIHLSTCARIIWRKQLLRKIDSSNAATALVTPEGYLVAASSEFHEICRHVGMNRFSPGSRVDFQFKEHVQLSRHKKLAVVSERVGGLFLIGIEHLPWLSELSQREAQIALAARKKSSAKEIARRFNLSPVTVSNHLARIYRKLSINSRGELAAL